MVEIKKEDSSAILSWGLEIKVSQCRMDDIRWAVEASIQNEMLKMIADAIKAAEWFRGKWYIKETGTIIRPYKHVSDGEGIEFRRISLLPIDPQSNCSALNKFGEIQKGKCSLSDEITSCVSLGHSYRLMANKSGFYIWEVQLEYDGNKIYFV